MVGSRANELAKWALGRLPSKKGTGADVSEGAAVVWGWGAGVAGSLLGTVGLLVLRGTALVGTTPSSGILSATQNSKDLCPTLQVIAEARKVRRCTV